jgi:hypothetical protein
VPAPLPALDPDTTAFWTGGQEGRLLITRCGTCRTWLHPPVPVCRFCLGTSVAPEQVAGTGTVLTYTVNRQQWAPDLAVPYVIAIVGLDEGPGLRVTTRLVGVDPPEVTIGMRVQVKFEHVSDGAGPDVWLPLFTPEVIAPSATGVEA